MRYAREERFRTSYLTYFDLLPDGKYKVYHVSNDKLHGEGEYTFDEKEQKVRWLSGPHKEVGYGGSFQVEAGGRKHVIRMSSLSIASMKKVTRPRKTGLGSIDFPLDLQLGMAG